MGVRDFLWDVAVAVDVVSVPHCGGVGVGESLE